MYLCTLYYVVCRERKSFPACRLSSSSSSQPRKPFLIRLSSGQYVDSMGYRVSKPTEKVKKAEEERKRRADACGYKSCPKTREGE